MRTTTETFPLTFRARLAARWQAWCRARTRRAILDLNPRLLADVGLIRTATSMFAPASPPEDRAREARQPAVFFGWRVVAAAFVLAIFGWGVGFDGPPVYLHAVSEARGWSLSALVSVAVTVHFLVGAAVVANLPKLYRRFGVAAVTKAGAVSLALGIVGWAVAREPWQLFAATLFSGAGWVAMGAAALNAIVALWFVRARPAALAAAYNGASVGGVIFSPLLVAAIGLLGFPLAAAAIGIVTIAAVWFLAGAYFTKTPTEMGLCGGWRRGRFRPASPSRRSVRRFSARSGATAASSRSRPAWRSASSRRSVCWRISSRCSCRRSAKNSPASRRAPPPPPPFSGARSSAG